MKQEQANRRRRTIFISNRHSDKAIADVLRTALDSWSNGQISVFESSDMHEHTLRAGQNLTDIQKKALADANVVILIYTVADQDWLSCLWECGLATDPTGQGTRIIILQYARDVPVPLWDQMRVTIDEEAIKMFTRAFHKDPNFFPGYSVAFAPELSEKEIETRSRLLFNELRRIVPNVSAR